MTTALAEALPRLAAHRDRLARVSLRSLLANDSDRFAAFSARLDDLTIDFSKVRIDRPALVDLVALAGTAGVEAAARAMFGGEPINLTEGRAVLHAALRAGPDDSFRTAGAEVTGEVRGVLERVLEFAEGVRSGRLHGERGAYSDVVNIGIGGSDLGPAMVTRALRPYHDGPRLHFVSNVDGAHIHDTLSGLDPARTLFIVASKTFTTVETMTNAATARRWIIDRQGEAAVGRHFAAVSTAVAKAGEFGIPADRVFGFWDWVGGRYSVWSAIGLPVAIAIGREGFSQFLAGARAMDRHFLTAPAAANLPVLLALIGVWHRNVWGFPAVAVLPYDQRLDRFAAYLQQLDMESNGKSVMLDGRPAPTVTGPLVWGEPGTNGQHAFYQFLHQGTDIVPCEFLVAAEGHELPLHHDLLVANCLAQSEALARGKTRAEAEQELRAQGLSATEVAALAPHKVFPGDRPSVTLLHRKLDPHALGRLIALYEHKVFVQGVLYGINSFDQWGVELGKQLASELLPVVRGEADPAGRDPSTAGLVATIRGLRGQRGGM